MAITIAETAEDGLIRPHGGVLVNLLADGDRRIELEAEAREIPKWVLTPRQLCDIEQLINGAFSPLTGFMGQSDYDSVCERMRLADGTLWPMPIVLDLPESNSQSLSSGDRLALMHPEGVLIGILNVSDVWAPDREAEALKVFGSTDTNHPGVHAALHQTNPVYVGGSIEALRASQHHTYSHLRHTPIELRSEFEARGWSRVVAFQTRNPMHRAHVELTRRAALEADAKLLIHPVVGLTRPGDVEYHTRVRCYRAVIDGYPDSSAALSLLQLAMRMGGPREAVWHAIVRKNYGCTHFIVGRDHAGPGNDADGNPYYGPYDAQDLVEEHREELGIKVVTFQEVVYEATTDRYMTREELPDGAQVMNLSGTELRDRLQRGAEIPEWFSYPEVISELRKSYPPLEQRGFNVFIVGLPGSGKSTLARVLQEQLLEYGTRSVTMLDDTAESSTVALVGREVARNGGVIITSSTESSAANRERVRGDIASAGVFVEVHLSTVASVCDARTSGKVAREAESEFDRPASAEIELDTGSVSPGDAAAQVMDYLEKTGLIAV